MLPSRLRLWFNGAIQPLGVTLASWGVHPHVLTLVGFVLSLASAGAFGTGRFRWGGLLLLVGGTFDVLDGITARESGKGSKFGALFDSTLDRYSEIAIYMGIVAYYLKTYQTTPVLVTVLALTGSLMVSYIRARVEGLGEECKIGMMQRTERVVYLGFGALAFGSSFIFLIVLAVVAVLTHFTAGQRVYYFQRQGRYRSRG